MTEQLGAPRMEAALLSSIGRPMKKAIEDLVCVGAEIERELATANQRLAVANYRAETAEHTVAWQSLRLRQLSTFIDHDTLRAATARWPEVPPEGWKP